MKAENSMFFKQESASFPGPDPDDSRLRYPLLFIWYTF
jgi:hypothetical protein